MSCAKATTSIPTKEGMTVTRVASSTARMNRALLIMTFVVTALLLALSVGLGVFSASPQDASVSDQLIEAAGEEELLEKTDTAPLSRVGDSTASASQSSETQTAEDVLADLKLQEVRDTYLRFEQAIPGVTVHYAYTQKCATDAVCFQVNGTDEILVQRDWALAATPEDMTYVLARAHADLAIKRIWGSDTAAATDLKMLIPACAVVEPQAVLDAAGIEAAAVQEAEAPVIAMKDIIVDQMVGSDSHSEVYPEERHTDAQIAAATQIAHAELPELVVPASAPSCQ